MDVNDSRLAYLAVGGCNKNEWWQMTQTRFVSVQSVVVQLILVYLRVSGCK